MKKRMTPQRVIFNIVVSLAILICGIAIGNCKAIVLSIFAAEFFLTIMISGKFKIVVGKESLWLNIAAFVWLAVALLLIFTDSEQSEMALYSLSFYFRKALGFSSIVFNVFICRFVYLPIVCVTAAVGTLFGSKKFTAVALFLYAIIINLTSVHVLRDIVMGAAALLLGASLLTRNTKYALIMSEISAVLTVVYFMICIKQYIFTYAFTHYQSDYNHPVFISAVCVLVTAIVFWNEFRLSSRKHAETAV